MTQYRNKIQLQTRAPICLSVYTGLFAINLLHLHIIRSPGLGKITDKSYSEHQFSFYLIFFGIQQPALFGKQPDQKHSHWTFLILREVNGTLSSKFTISFFGNRLLTYFRVFFSPSPPDKESSMGFGRQAICQSVIFFLS